MRLSSLTLLAFQLITYIDNGKYQDISIDDIKTHIDAGDLLSYLNEKIGDDIDLSLFIPNYDYSVPEEFANNKGSSKDWIRSQVISAKYNEEAGAELIDALQRRLNAVGGEGIGSKIVNSGLCYLLSSTIGLIADREWQDIRSERQDKRAKIVESYFEIAKLVDAWPDIPEGTRKEIMKLALE